MFVLSAAWPFAHMIRVLWLTSGGRPSASPHWLVVLALRARPTTQKLFLQFHLHHQIFPLLKLKTNLYSLFKFIFNSNTNLLHSKLIILNSYPAECGLRPHLLLGRAAACSPFGLARRLVAGPQFCNTILTFIIFTAHWLARRIAITLNICIII